MIILGRNTHHVLVYFNIIYCYIVIRDLHCNRRGDKSKWIDHVLRRSMIYYRPFHVPVLRASFRYFLFVFRSRCLELVTYVIIIILLHTYLRAFDVLIINLKEKTHTREIVYTHIHLRIYIHHPSILYKKKKKKKKCKKKNRLIVYKRLEEQENRSVPLSYDRM